MAINITPNVSVDALRNLDADKTYFLSSTTGKIKEASCWMRFKCAIGVKSAREKVGNLVEAVRTALLQSAGLRKDDVLETDIRAMDTRFMISGSALKNVFSRFSSVNSEAMMRREAEGLARMEANVGFQFVNQRNFLCGPDRDIISVFQHAFKAVVNGKLPTKQDESGRTVLDKTAFTLSLRSIRDEVKTLLLDICDDERLGTPSIDRHFARHIVTTMFREDGTRNENGFSDLQTPDEAFASYLYNLDSHNRTINTQIHRELVKKGIDPVAYAKNIRAMCGGDADLEDIVELGLRNICGTGDNKLRSDDKVAAKIAALKDNLAEAREVEKRFPGFMPEFKEAMFALSGAAMPRGSITRLAEEAGRRDFSALAKLNSFSGPGTIIAAIDQLRVATDEIANPRELFAENRDEIMYGGPEFTASRRIVQAIALAKAGPVARARIANVVNGTAYREAAYILETRQTEAKSVNLFTGREKELRKSLLEEELKVVEELHTMMQPHDRVVEELDTSDITWEQAMEDNDLDADEILNGHIAAALKEVAA